MRLFLAVDVGEAVRQALRESVSELCALAPRARWVSPDNWHVTLLFLGEHAESTVPAMVDVLRPAVRGMPPLELEAAGAGAFGPSSRPRVLWAGVLGSLAPLQQAVAAAFQPWAQAAEPAEAFTPHLTLARARHPRGDVELARCHEALSGRSWGGWPCDAVVLYRNERARYHPVLSAALQG